MAELLLEIYSEEIPADAQKNAEGRIRQDLLQNLAQVGLDIKESQTKISSGPNRLAICITDLPAKTKEIITEIKGPPQKVDEKIIGAFLQKHQAKQTQLTIQKNNKGSFYFLQQIKPSQKIEDILANPIRKTLREFHWKKYMRWENQDFRWIAPIRKILCLLDNKVIDFEIAAVKSGNKTKGHSTIGNNQDISIDDYQHYQQILAQNKVITTRIQRGEIIEQQINEIQKKHNLQIIPDPYLFELVIGLAEYPKPLLGFFDEKFLKLPEEVITEILKQHQKCFCLKNENNQLAPNFITIANVGHNSRAITKGYEKVVTARLEDGLFSMNNDIRIKLEQHTQMLAEKTYHSELGNMQQKCQRLKILAQELATLTAADSQSVQRAAEIAKFDLSCEMVKEFPKLQGLIGSHYAEHYYKEQKSVALAIKDQYLPLGETTAVPQTAEAICLALADKIDSIAGFFAIGKKPRGSKDPFALRRATLGIIRIAIEKKISIDIEKYSASALQQYQNQHIIKNDENHADIIAEIKLFFDERYRNWKNNKNIFDINNKGDYLIRYLIDDFLLRPEGTKLYSLIKRAFNILEIEQKKERKTYRKQDIDTKLLQSNSEICLYENMRTAEQQIASYMKDENYNEALNTLARLQKPIDDFFNENMVNDENAKLRCNRLSLLAYAKAIVGYSGFTIS